MRYFRATSFFGLVTMKHLKALYERGQEENSMEFGTEPFRTSLINLIRCSSSANRIAKDKTLENWSKSLVEKAELGNKKTLLKEILRRSR